MRRDKLGLAVLVTLTAVLCVIARDGQSNDRKKLVDAFLKADVTKRLEMLPALTKAIPEKELPPEARYLTALQLLRPHLAWQAPMLVANYEGRRLKREEDADGWSEHDWRWNEALGPETWMFADVPAEVRERANKLLEARTEPAGRPPQAKDYAWHLKDPQHADVQRATAMLQEVRDRPGADRVRALAGRWLAEVERNNTALTLDVVGSYGPGRDTAVVLDARNAERVNCKLYRVKNPRDLVWVAERIGKDFIFLDQGHESEKELCWCAEEMASAKSVRRLEYRPGALNAKPVWEQRKTVADLKPAPRGAHCNRWENGDDDASTDANYFDDDCLTYRHRLEKRYRDGLGQWTCWQCDRWLDIPGKALAEAGAYILAVEAHGQTCYAPLIVEPLTLTMRRCRDGIFVVVADTENKKPIAGATVHGCGDRHLEKKEGEEEKPAATTDAEGVAFARLHGGGDRAVVVHKDGRFAIGGFGRVFDGIYYSPLDREDRHLPEAKERKRGRQHEELAAHLYADNHLVAAYTDRPTYRPGQEVNFKFIVRKLIPEEQVAKDRPQAFRAADFDFSSRLELPEKGVAVPFEVLDRKYRSAGQGTLTLNEFGTASGKFALNSEAAVGTYSLRLNIAGVDRAVPEVFAVEYYRLPSFKLDMAGVPALVKKAAELRIELTGAYYFGKPLAGAEATVQLTKAGERYPLQKSTVKLDGAGKAVVNLDPRKLAPGRYAVRCELTDEGGRTVERVLPYAIEPSKWALTGLELLPRFTAADKPIEFPTQALRITIQSHREPHPMEQAPKDMQPMPAAKKPRRYAEKPSLVTPAQGIATVKFPQPGWYTISDGTQSVDIFAYGGASHPFEVDRRSEGREDPPQPMKPPPGEPNDAEPETREPDDDAWFDLASDQRVEDPDWKREMMMDRLGWRGHNSRNRPHLLGLRERQELKVGETLRVLLYIPAGQARMVLTLEGRTVVDYRMANTKSEGCYHVAEIPIRARQYPHFYLRGFLLNVTDERAKKAEQRMQKLGQERNRLDAADDEDGYDPRWCRVDVIDPNIRPGGDKLLVEVKTDRAVYRPGDKVEARVTVTDLEGRPAVGAEVSLAAIDASIYAFGEDRLPELAGIFGDRHPAQRFLEKKWRSAVGKRWAQLAERRRDGRELNEKAQKLEQQREALQQKMAREVAREPVELAALPLEALGELPVGAIPLARLRSDFRETAAWLPHLETDDDGEATATFKLPDSLTSYRVSAVALTKTTQIGTGRATMRASLPLAVQLLLPRFAIENDRLAAVGVIHNDSAKERVCNVTWQVDEAVIAGQLNNDRLHEFKQEGNKAIGKVTIPAGKSARVALSLGFERVGTAKVNLRVAADTDGDAEERSLTVQPLGREQTVDFTGDFTGSKKIKLPAGFMARDVHVVMSWSDIAQSLEGVAGLVDYPYGCVEQSMSRFLPAVLVAHASKRTPLLLHEQDQARLPHILETGLTRLYNFQHADNGWGWWEHDRTDPRMTIYVVYGLARCAEAGVKVDPDVFQRGIAWITTELKNGRLTGPLAARAWLALAHAKQADPASLKQYAERLLADKSDAEARVLVALACHLGGHDIGKRLWATARDWKSEYPEEVALLLKAQIAFGEPTTKLLETGTRLTKFRCGLSWGNTQATAAAIDSLSLLIPILPVKTPFKKVGVTVAGRQVMNLSKPEDLKTPVFRARLHADKVFTADAAEIELVAAGDAPMKYVIEAAGLQQQDKLEPVGTAVKITRRYETLDGKLLMQPIKASEVFAVRVQVDLQGPQNYVLIEDRRPAGCEFADRELHGPGAAGFANVEFRDDRVCVFASHLEGQREFVYYLRAETPGVSQVLPGVAYPMYSDKIRGETGAARIEIADVKRK